MKLTGRPQSVWLSTAARPTFPSLAENLTVDVAIVGGGITGITAALLLAETGKRVAVFEKGRLGGGETGHTTAHLTELVDGRYQDLVSDFGIEGARLVSECSRAAIDHIEAWASTCAPRCGFVRLPGFLYTERESDVDTLRAESESAAQAGVACSFTTDVPLPFKTHGAIRVDGQGQFHSIRYLFPLTQAIERAGGRIFENTSVIAVEDGDPCRVEAEGGTVTATTVIVAANVPVNNRVAVHTKIAAYRSYAVAMRIKAKNSVNGLFWDTDDPYHYTRTHDIEGEHLLIVGGEDHKVGSEDETEEAFLRLDEYARARFDVSGLAYRWSGQIIEPVDGLPYIGRNPGAGHVYIATGYSGNGMTFGTIAGMMLSDLILRRPNPYAELFDPRRVKPIAAGIDYVRENKDYLAHLAKDRLTNANADPEALDEVPRNEGRIVVVDGKKYAVFRDAHGGVHALSPVCTHLYCDVSWNSAERSWDCPCHGSRFDPEGRVLNGPAVQPLERVDLRAARKA